MNPAVSRSRTRLVALLILLAIAAPAGMAAARYPRYWLWIALEETPMTWLQTVLLVLAAAAAGLVAVIGRLRSWSASSTGSPFESVRVSAREACRCMSATRP